MPDPQQIDIWYLDTTHVSDAAAQTLSPEEQARAARFVRPVDRIRFTAARAALRAVLAHYLSLPPAAIEFLFGPYQKPYLATPGTLSFNLSHSESLAAIAVTSTAELGIDIEFMRAIDYLAIAERNFDPSERATLQALPGADRKLGFYTAWTRKEAFMKAVGMGLHLEPASVVVSLNPHDPPALISVPDPRDWSLYHLDPAPGFAGALVAQGRHHHLEIHPVGQAFPLAVEQRRHR